MSRDLKFREFVFKGSIWFVLTPQTIFKCNDGIKEDNSNNKLNYYE